ncbi:hypothetical protein MLD38_029187 [Melastoma candidum]|uniref:Uncharacterized protein n=1 Tax=Melastoma candidum TaxID=119954 RepID=A0ACB9N3U7_9MYRT|nr:hypothetical protein MLD38_029187 [Melastoma candidum]
MLKIIAILFLCLPCLLPANSKISLDVVCGRNEPTIRFPFHIRTLHQEQCGYPGFDVFCDGMNRTIIELPNMGNFSIQGIDYVDQQVWLNDPENCLPKKILSLNLSGSPFAGVYYHNFSFFNCSSDYRGYGPKPIACVSSDAFSIFATPLRGVHLSHLLRQQCRYIKTVAVPVQLPFFVHELSSDLSEDLRLTWNTPRCGRCTSRGSRCSLKANSKDEIECIDIPRQEVPRAARYAVTFGALVPALLCLIGLVCFVSGKVKSSSSRCPDLPSVSRLPPLPPSPRVPLGLRSSIVNSYPWIVLGESMRLPKPDDTACPICLSEYRPKDALRTIPECDHCFHATCVDEWLRLNSSCPVCRKCPAPQTGV